MLIIGRVGFSFCSFLNFNAAGGRGAAKVRLFNGSKPMKNPPWQFVYRPLYGY